MKVLNRLILRRTLILTAKFSSAAMLALGIAQWATPGDYLSTAFVALSTLQPTLRRGLRASADQIIATLVGIIGTIVVVLFTHLDFSHGPSFGHTAAASALVALVSILGFKGRGLVIALFTVLYLTLMPWPYGKTFWGVIDMRFAAIILGIAISTVLNFIFSLFRHQDRLHFELLNLSRKMTKYLLDYEDGLTFHLKVPSKDNAEIDKLSPLMLGLTEIFGDLRVLQEDVEEIQKERIQLTPLLLKWFPFLKLSMEDREVYQYRLGLTLRINNMAHFLWNILITLINLPLSKERHRHLQTFISQFVLHYRHLHKILEDLDEAESQSVVQNMPYELQSSIDEELDSKGSWRILEEFEMSKATPEEQLYSASAMTIVADMVHLERNLIRFAEILEKYIRAVKAQMDRRER